MQAISSWRCHAIVACTGITGNVYTAAKCIGEEQQQTYTLLTQMVPRVQTMRALEYSLPHHVQLVPIGGIRRLLYRTHWQCICAIYLLKQCHPTSTGLYVKGRHILSGTFTANACYINESLSPLMAREPALP